MDETKLLSHYLVKQNDVIEVITTNTKLDGLFKYSLISFI